MKKESYNTKIYSELIGKRAFSSDFEREFLENRWLHEVNWFTKSTRRSRRLYFSLSTISIVSTALLTVTASVSALSDETIFKILNVALSFTSVVSVGLFTLFKPWDGWKRRSTTLEQLKSTGREYIAKIGRFRELSDDDAFDAFFYEVQGIVSSYKDERFSQKPFIPKDNSVESEEKA